MNVQIEKKPDCIAMLHVELPAEKVQGERARIQKLFQQKARIPGFRPGKAPLSVVSSRYADDIREELEHRLVNEALREAIQQEKIDVIEVTRVNKVEIDEAETLRFTATLMTAPDFDLPDYKSVEVELEEPVVTDENIDNVIEGMREQQADFEDVEGRGLEWDDFAVLNYAATLDGTPLAELIEDAPRTLCGGDFTWLRMSEETLLPGFCGHLVGAQLDESRAFDLEIGDSFPMEPLRGKTVHYEVTVAGIKKRILPAVDDAFAEKVEPGLTADALRDRIRENFVSMQERQFAAQKRNVTMRALLAKFDCEVPAELLKNEMESVLQEIVHENQMRGISDDLMREHEGELIGAAQQNARDRLRGNFLLQRIADAEKLDVANEEVAQEIMAMAQQYQTTFEKMLKDLRKRNALPLVRDQILRRKALDLVVANATVLPPSPQTEEATPTAEPSAS